MRTTLKPIPTLYAGCHFRSRLEANFAATFDHLGVVWDYEPEGFELSDGTKYLPDFHLPALDTWVEVKGAHGQRVDKFEQFAADLWNNHEPDEYGEKNSNSPGAPLCILATVNNEFHLLPSWMRFIGVRELGRRYSVHPSTCPCGALNLWVIGATACRSCGMARPVADWFKSGNNHLQAIKAPVEQWRPRSR